MSFPSIQAVRITRAVSALTLVMATAACGGGDVGTVEPSAAPSAQATQHTAAATSVVMEGCVVDRHYIPATGTPVRVLGTDGRLLGHAQSDGQGRFKLRLPLAGDVTLQVDRPQGESLPMRVGTSPSTWATCLLDEQA